MNYKHCISFTPKNSNPHYATEIKTVSFTNNILNKNKIKHISNREVVKQKIIDEYALRNHWDIFKMEVIYNNPPWKNTSELYSDILSINGVKSVNKVDSTIYIYVYDDFSTLDVYTEIGCYYSGFSPNVKDNKIKIEHTPSYI